MFQHRVPFLVVSAMASSAASAAAICLLIRLTSSASGWVASATEALTDLASVPSSVVTVRIASASVA